MNGNGEVILKCLGYYKTGKQFQRHPFQQTTFQEQDNNTAGIFPYNLRSSHLPSTPRFISEAILACHIVQSKDTTEL